MGLFSSVSNLFTTDSSNIQEQLTEAKVALAKAKAKKVPSSQIAQLAAKVEHLKGALASAKAKERKR